MSRSESDIQRQMRERERQRKHDEEQTRLQQAFNSDGELDRGWMKEMLDTDDLEEYLDEYQIKKVRGLINRQWVLANLSDAQTHDRWHKLDVMYYKITGEFPPSESVIQGPARAFLLDEKTEQLNALTPEERNVIDQIITSLQNMVTRSTEGFERKQMNTNIARTEREDTENEQNSGGRFGGLF